jgi:undecaprenyl-diphosphatase
VDLLAAALLGIVQGVTEFLPVSSSAHLILARAFFGWDAERFGLSFDVACHVGTLLALVIYFRQDVTSLLRAVPQMLNPVTSSYAQLAWLLVVGTIPVALVGLFLNDRIANTLRTPSVAAASLALGAGWLFLVERIGPRQREVGGLTVWAALAVGSAQALALIPGVSRSGATIAMGMILGLRRDSAARFSFLLGIPAVFAAAAHQFGPALREMQAPGVAQLFLVGILVSGGVGYIVIKYLMRYLAKHSLDAFAYYRLGLAAAAGLWLFMTSN